MVERVSGLPQAVVLLFSLSQAFFNLEWYATAPADRGYTEIANAVLTHNHQFSLRPSVKSSSGKFRCTENGFKSLER